MGLSAEEKAGNKAANRVRGRAHRERYQAMQAALKAADESPEVVMAKHAFGEADAKSMVVMQERDRKVAELEQQIEQLEAQLQAVRSSPEWEAACADRRTKLEARNSLRTAKSREVEAAFPDLEGAAMYSAAAWKPPPEVLAAMEQARQDAGKA